MTYEQAQIYIKIFILQHYDKNIEDVIPDVYHHGKVCDLYGYDDGDWVVANSSSGYIFWANRKRIEAHGNISLRVTRTHMDENFNILDYITLEEEEI